jgi:hypothetical protein
VNNFPSCFRRGLGGGKPANPRLPLGLFPGQPAPGLYRRGVGILCTRHWRFLVTPTGKGVMQVSLNKS